MMNITREHLIHVDIPENELLKIVEEFLHMKELIPRSYKAKLVYFKGPQKKEYCIKFVMEKNNDIQSN